MLLAMHAVEFTTELNEDGSLSIPMEARLRLPNKGPARIIVLTNEEASTKSPAEVERPDPVAALNFAREHGLEEGRTDEYLRELRGDD